MRHEARQVPSWLIFDVSQMKRIAFLLLIGSLVAQPIYFVLDAAEQAAQAQQAQDAKLLRVLDIYGRSIIGLMDAGLAIPPDASAAAIHKDRMRAQASLDMSARERIDRRARSESFEEPPPVTAAIQSAFRRSLNPGYVLLCCGVFLLILDARRQSVKK
jgi:hypothetical protein